MHPDDILDQEGDKRETWDNLDQGVWLSVQEEILITTTSCNDLPQPWEPGEYRRWEGGRSGPHLGTLSRIVSVPEWKRSSYHFYYWLSVCRVTSKQVGRVWVRAVRETGETWDCRRWRVVTARQAGQVSWTPTPTLTTLLVCWRTLTRRSSH